jgi:K+-transporting ATPase ATPase B chain
MTLTPSSTAEATDLVPPPETRPPKVRTRSARSLFDRSIVRRAVVDSFVKLNPRVQARNPVMFVVLVGSAWTTVLFVRDVPHASAADNVFVGLVAAWLWFTVLFANFAEAMAEGRGKAQADTLRKTRSQTVAYVLQPDGTTRETPSAELQVGDRCVVEAGQLIPGDGEVIEGIASVDESAITGESAPVIRESGGDRSAVTGGTRVLSDRIVVKISTRPGESFIDRMIALVEGAERQKTPNEIALNILLAALTIIFLLAVVTLQPFAAYSHARQPITVLVALLVCLIPTTIGALLSAIGIAGMDRLVQRNVLAMSGRAVEAAGDVSTLLLDKTGTITYGNRMASELIPVGGTDERTLAEVALLSSLADETPEGRSIVELAESRYGLHPVDMPDAELVPFTAQTRMSGIEWRGRSIRKGAADAVRRWAAEQGGRTPDGLAAVVDGIAVNGGTPLVVAEGPRILGVIHLKDTIKAGMVERFAEMRRMGIRTVMITGDNPLTAKAIATEAGVDDFMAEATPEDKMARIRAEQAGGNLVAMTGDGTNDAPALAQADVGVAMNSGTQAAKEAGNMVDLDSNPTKLLEIVEIGKQLLITRGSLTTFSIANDVAKYFAIIPAMFQGVFPQLRTLNVMKLDNPHSAILSAVIFNALIIVALIPLALRGVKFRAVGAAAILRRNILVYGLGGVVAPFVGIKLIDLLLVAMGVR